MTERASAGLLDDIATRRGQQRRILRVAALRRRLALARPDARAATRTNAATSCPASTAPRAKPVVGASVDAHVVRPVVALARRGGLITPAMWPDAPSTNVTSPPTSAVVRYAMRHGTMWSSREASTYDGHRDARQVDRLAAHRQRAAARAACCRDTGCAGNTTYIGPGRLRRIAVPVQEVERAAASRPSGSC